MLRAPTRPAAIDSCARTPNVPSPLASKVRPPAVAQPRKRTRLVPRRPTAAVEHRRLRRAGDDALQLAAAAAGQADAELLDHELVVRAGERQAQRADGFLPTLAWSIRKVARERLSAGSRSRMPMASGTTLSRGPASSLAPAMRSRSSQRDARLISTARASRHRARNSPVMSWGRPSCSNDSARLVSVAPCRVRVESGSEVERGLAFAGTCFAGCRLLWPPAAASRGGAPATAPQWADARSAHPRRAACS